MLSRAIKQTVGGHDLEASGGLNISDDVKQEQDRILSQLAGPQESRDAVIIKDIHKVYPQYMGNPAKVAVRTLTMGVSHGECFGMLGPNGAGKTTTINMLVGFTQPTSGTAEIEGFDICRDMDRIYTLMGVCPQHDILWDTLTARQHMVFYGRLKNVNGPALNEAVIQGLKQVNLLHVMNEMAGTFSGGMKRRLSVAISLIGSPLCCYLVNIFALGMISFVGRMHVLKTYLYKNNSRTKTTH
jgi:ABC-type lipopolysaccharide export system ATPase subunit